MLPTLVKHPPSGEKWLHEIKHDGYRTQLILNGSERRALTRNGFDWSDSYRHVLNDAARLKCSSAIIDGELIIQDHQGRSDFSGLELAIERTPERLIFYAFDLLHLNGDDLREEMLIDRRERLQDLIGVRDPGCSVHYSEHVVGGGAEFFDVACGAELEGIVSKKITSRYCSGRSKAWLKAKSFVEDEFVVVGYHDGRGTAPCALLARETADGLQYAGSAFVTLQHAERETFWRAMERLAVTRSPIDGLPASASGWVRPGLRVRAKHLRCSGKLRHATLKGVRSIANGVNGGYMANEGDKHWEERLKKITKPGRGRNVGDDTPNPLPANPSDSDNEGGGDAGRT